MSARPRVHAGALTVIDTAVRLPVPPAHAYAFATTPAHWTRWHPATRAVSGATNHPLSADERVIERIRVGGRGDTVVWTVRRHDAPRRWMIEGVGAHGCARITYRLMRSADGGTLFARRLAYRSHARLWRACDAWLVAPLLHRQSVLALKRLRAVLSAEATAPPADEIRANFFASAPSDSSHPTAKESPRWQASSRSSSRPTASTTSI